MKRLVISLAIILSVVGPATAFSEDALPFKRPVSLDGVDSPLTDKDPVVLRGYARELGEKGARDKVRELSDLLLADPDESVRLAAMGALLAIGDRSALPAYGQALRDRSDKVRQSAADALSGVWDRDGQRALLSALRTDPSPKVRQHVVLSLGNPGLTGLGSAHNWDAAGETVSALIQVLNTDTSYEVRANAADMLGNSGDERALAPLITALTKDPSAAVRSAAAESLGAFNRPEAVGPLIDVVSFEEDDTVVVSALKALKYFDDPRISGPVVAALRSASSKVRWQAMDVIEVMKPKEAVRPVEDIEGDNREEEGNRAKAREVLQLLGVDREGRYKD